MPLGVIIPIRSAFPSWRKSGSGRDILRNELNILSGCFHVAKYTPFTTFISQRLVTRGSFVTVTIA